MKTMAEVLGEHGYMNSSKERYCQCGVYLGEWATEQDFAAHQADALTAAGFGPVKAAQAEQPRRRRRESRPVPATPEDMEPYKYPPDPYWGTDERGRFQYVDYDGESLHVWADKDGELWIDKRGEGPVYIRSEHISVIVKAIQDAARAAAVEGGE